ncbi:MAG: biotin carboxylase [Corynebacteriales bacterium]|nr:biotin carboxylase [Mycobacteriales bacterium]
MFSAVLVANRGEIALRIINTVQKLGMTAIAVHADVDAELPYVAKADEAVNIGPPGAYRDIEVLLDVAKRTNAQAIHPGYGFLAENAEFAQAVIDAGYIWIGPAPETIAAVGDKNAARESMAAVGVPVAPGFSAPLDMEDESFALAGAEQVQYPVLLKPSAGGGGMGMAVVHSAEQFATQFQKVASYARRAFGGAVLVERYYERVRHVEVQILGLPDGEVIALGERDCSVQRRYQKLVEETPAPTLGPALRERFDIAAVQAGAAIGYLGAGTVEFLLDVDTREFFFCEINTRLQVEHPVTEEAYGVDLVAAQLEIAAGTAPTWTSAPPEAQGHALELRINAEDPKRFLPGPGTITHWHQPSGPGVRVDAGYQLGNVVTPNFDPLLAKLIISGPDRYTVLERARAAVEEFEIVGPKNNLAFHAELLNTPEFISGEYDTGIVGRMRA